MANNVITQGVLPAPPLLITQGYSWRVPAPGPTSASGITEMRTDAQKLAADTHRLAAHTENPAELYFLRDGGWHMFPVQPLSGPAQGLELTQTYKQPSTLGFVLPDPDGLYAAENRNSAYNYNASGAFDPLMDEARKISLRVGTKCYQNLAAGIAPTASIGAGLGTLAKLTDGIFTNWTGSVPFANGVGWALSGTAPTLDVTVDLGASYFIQHTVIRFGTRVGGFTLPSNVSLLVSNDNVNWRWWPARPVGGSGGDWAESIGGQGVPVAVCDIQTAARYVRWHVVGVDGSTDLGIDEVAVYGGSHFSVFGANLFTGYLGDQIDFTPEGHIQCLATDVLKKLADNNEVFVTAIYRLNPNAWELADIAYSLLTSSAYWKGTAPYSYDAHFTAAEIGWSSGGGLTGLQYPLWQGQTNSILGYCLELFNTIGWNFFADGNGVLQATNPPTTQRLPDRVCIAGQDGNGDVWDCKRHRTGKQLRNSVYVMTGLSNGTGSGLIHLFDPNSIKRYGTRTTRITDPLASTTYLRRQVALYFLRDYAWNIQTLTTTIRPQFGTAMKQIFGFRAQARPNLYAKTSVVGGALRQQEMWSLVGLTHNICYGKWEAEASWVPYVCKAADPPNFLQFNSVGGHPTWMTIVRDAITDPTVVYVKVYASTTGEFGTFTQVAADAAPSITTSIFPVFQAGVDTWCYLTAVDIDGNESIPSQILNAIPGSSSSSITCYTITDFTIASISTQGPDSQGYYTYQFLGLWTAPACGFTQDDVRAIVSDTPPADPDNPASWPIHDDSFNWWGPNRIQPGLTWDNSTPGQLDFTFTFRTTAVLSGLKMYWKIYNSARTRAWIPVPGNYDSCIVA